MSFGVHVKGLHERVVNAFIRRVMKREWGLKEKTVRMIYKEDHLKQA